MNLVESMRTMSSKKGFPAHSFSMFFVGSIMKHQFLKPLTLEMQFVRETAGFHGQVIHFEQLIRWKVGFHGQVIHFEQLIRKKAGFSGQNHIL